ncbi:lysozyme inhibitor LprI family protein [Beggiatoa leptomitoformis]|nr:lysozyme inhibitor LprI family protein [Beggiatoa leptomitoformis]
MKKFLLLPIRLSFYALLLSSCALRAAEGDSVVKNVWNNLDKTTNQCADLYDYFPNGGILSFYCHAKTFLGYDDLHKLFGKAIFVQGPHTETTLDLKNKESFGYYNPAFVEWLGNMLILTSDDKATQMRLQPLYDTYIAPLARTYFVVYKELQAQPNFLTQEKTTYLGLLKSKSLPDYYADKYYDFAALSSNNLYEGNIVKNAVLFWIRRHIDDTQTLFFQNLQKLLTTYDVGFLKHYECQQAQTPSQRLSCADYEYNVADQALNVIYQKLNDKFDADKQERLKAAQRAWLVFRDTNAKLLISTGAYKGIAEEDIAMLTAKKDLTASRVSELQALDMEAQ